MTQSDFSQAETPWFTSYGTVVPKNLTYRSGAVFSFLDDAAKNTPNSFAIQFQKTKITYAELHRQAEVLAANLRAGGLGRNDRVGIMLPNLPQTLISFWGVLKAGGVVVMINPLYMEKELLHLVEDAEIKHFITIDSCWPKIDKLRSRLGVERYYITTAHDALSFPYKIFDKCKSLFTKSTTQITCDGEHILPFSELLRGRIRLSMPLEDPDSVALLQYTGGTTGRSKGVMLTHKNLVANIKQSAATLHLLKKDQEIFMAVLPLFHVYGLTTCILLPVLLRACVVTIPRFLPAELLQSIDTFKVTVLPGAPSLYIALLQYKSSKEYSLTTLKYCISGSAPMPLEYLHQFKKRFSALLIEGYGLSEASPITHLNPMALDAQKIGTIGVPLPDTIAKIVDMEVGHITMPPNTIGELVLRGPQVMKGYWKNPDETANALRNGWLYTGDIAVMDETGYFTLVDRKKDMVIAGGFNVSPREIDEVLYEHPKIKDAVTVGVPHAIRGEVIKAYIVLHDAVIMEKSEVVMWCRQKLATYKVPRQVEFRKELPKNLVGKVLRRTLREEETEKIRKGQGDNDIPDLADKINEYTAIYDEGSPNT